MSDAKGPYNEDEVIKALIDNGGNISATARELGRRRSSLKEYIDSTGNVLRILIDIREELVDMAEDNMFLAVKKGDGRASRYILSTLGKDRGYTQKNTTALEAGNNVNITINKQGDNADST